MPQVLMNDNLELGCTFIEKAATDKAIREIDERLLPAYQVWRSCAGRARLCDSATAQGAICKS